MATEIVPTYVLKLRELQDCARRLHSCLLGVAAITPERETVGRELMQAVQAAQDCDLALERAQRRIDA